MLTDSWTLPHSNCRASVSKYWASWRQKNTSLHQPFEMDWQDDVSDVTSFQGDAKDEDYVPEGETRSTSEALVSGIPETTALHSIMQPAFRTRLISVLSDPSLDAEISYLQRMALNAQTSSNSRKLVNMQPLIQSLHDQRTQQVTFNQLGYAYALDHGVQTWDNFLAVLSLWRLHETASNTANIAHQLSMSEILVRGFTKDYCRSYIFLSKWLRVDGPTMADEMLQSANPGRNKKDPIKLDEDVLLCFPVFEKLVRHVHKFVLHCHHVSPWGSGKKGQVDQQRLALRVVRNYILERYFSNT